MKSSLETVIERDIEEIKSEVERSGKYEEKKRYRNS